MTSATSSSSEQHFQNGQISLATLMNLRSLASIQRKDQKVEVMIKSDLIEIRRGAPYPLTPSFHPPRKAWLEAFPEVCQGRWTGPNKVMFIEGHKDIDYKKRQTWLDHLINEMLGSPSFQTTLEEIKGWGNTGQHFIDTTTIPELPEVVVERVNALLPDAVALQVYVKYTPNINQMGKKRHSYKIKIRGLNSIFLPVQDSLNERLWQQKTKTIIPDNLGREAMDALSQTMKSITMQEGHKPVRHDFQYLFLM